jgi:hypothetical protein
MQIFLEQENIKTLEQQPCLETLHYTFDMPLKGDGWHVREFNGDTYWRFTGPNEHATLFFPKILAPQNEISFIVFHAATKEHMDEFKVIYNHIELEIRSNENNKALFKIPTKAVHSQNHTLIEIITPPAIRASANDNRFLGIAFSRIEVR